MLGQGNQPSPTTTPRRCDRCNERNGQPSSPVAYIAIAVTYIVLIDNHDWPERLYLVFFLCLYNGLYFLLIGLVSLPTTIPLRTGRVGEVPAKLNALRKPVPRLPCLAGGLG